MDYVAVPFPERIAFGAQAEPMWNTDVAATRSGHEATNRNWTHTRHRYNVSLSVRDADDYALVRTHFHLCRGRARKFRFRDFLDFQAHATATTAGELGTTVVVDDSPFTLQLYKLYGVGQSTAYARKITRPVASTFRLWRVRSSVASDVTSSATLSAETGTLTVTGNADGDEYYWTGEFDVPCRYGADQLPAAVINKTPGHDGRLLVSCDSIEVLEVRE